VKPKVQAANFSAANVTGNSLLLPLAKGNGQGRFVVVRKGALVNVVPQDLTAYNGNEEMVNMDKKKEYSDVLTTRIDEVRGQMRLLSNPVRDNLVVLFPVTVNTKTECESYIARLQMSSSSVKPASY
jgi:hypothetical protein